MGQVQYRWWITEEYICSKSPVDYRWITAPSSDYICSDGKKYYKQYKQISYDGGKTWENVYPEETQTGNLIDAKSTDCGFSSRTVSTSTTCVGVDKYSVNEYQESYDYGVTWQTISSSTGNLIEANSTDCGYVPPITGNYLTFIATENCTFKFSGNSVNYSLNGGSWTSLASNTNISVNRGDKVMWKARLTPSVRKGIGFFSSNGKFTASGNPMSLLFGDEFEGKTSLSGKDYAFQRLFNGCTKITSAENIMLPATTLSEYCYAGMFEGCTSLITIPVLSAKTMVNRCYESMYENCTSITTIPSDYLPSTTLATYCYRSMFQGCTSLTTSPVLSAKTLAEACYAGMFDGCSSLTTAPELPAKTLAKWCYDSMFNGCSSLTTAPVLSATRLADECYRVMFSGCENLTTAPELPATTMKYRCYANMFKGCSSLTTAPVLSAKTLVDECYYAMFSGCTSLNSVTCLATNINANICTKDWVKGVASSGTFIKSSSMNSWTTGNNGIPSGWAIENYSS